VDAEELSEPNGYKAKLALQEIIGSASITCTASGSSSHSRIVARCYIEAVEINQRIVASGWALDCAKYSGGAYRKFEPSDARTRLKQKPYC
jgi:endonuclease YncB( thermonuclease family)